jgi:hypothetical protein
MITVIGSVINVNTMVNSPILRQSTNPSTSSRYNAPLPSLHPAHPTHLIPVASGTVYTPLGPLEALEPMKMTEASEMRTVKMMLGMEPSDVAGQCRQGMVMPGREEPRR